MLLGAKSDGTGRMMIHTCASTYTPYHYGGSSGDTSQCTRRLERVSMDI